MVPYIFKIHPYILREINPMISNSLPRLKMPPTQFFFKIRFPALKLFFGYYLVFSAYIVFNARLRRVIDNASIVRKTRPMAGAVPAFFIRIPFQLAAQMGTPGLYDM